MRKKNPCCHKKAMKPIKVFAPYDKQGQRRRIFHVFEMAKGTQGTQGTQGARGDMGDTGDTWHTRGHSRRREYRGHRGHKDTREKRHTGELRTFSTFRDCYMIGLNVVRFRNYLVCSRVFHTKIGDPARICRLA